MKKYTVSIQYDGIEENAFSYAQKEQEQVCETFPMTVDDKKLVSVEVVVEHNGKKESFAAEWEDKKHKNHRIVWFDMPNGNVTMTAKYVVDDSRVKMTFDLANVENVMAEEPSYFYSTMDAWEGDSYKVEKDKTFYYDDGEHMTFYLRLTIDADVRLLAGKEYAPEEKKKKETDGQTTYEYVFGFIDDLDPDFIMCKPVVLHAPTTTISFVIL